MALVQRHTYVTLTQIEIRRSCSVKIPHCKCLASARNSIIPYKKKIGQGIKFDFLRKSPNLIRQLLAAFLAFTLSINSSNVNLICQNDSLPKSPNIFPVIFSA